MGWCLARRLGCLACAGLAPIDSRMTAEVATTHFVNKRCILFLPAADAPVCNSTGDFFFSRTTLIQVRGADSGPYTAF